MIDLALYASGDSAGDLQIPLALVRDIDQIRQEVSSRLKFFRGEFFLDETVGVAYYDGILTKTVSRSFVEAELKSTILSVEGVASLITFQTAFDSATRAYSVSFSALTDLGEVTMEVSI